MNATYLFAVAAEGLLSKGLGSLMGVVGIILAIGCMMLFGVWLTTRYIPNNLVGVVEKLWSSDGSVAEGCIIALNGEAGYQADLLRGGYHFKYPRWQYR